MIDPLRRAAAEPSTEAVARVTRRVLSPVAPPAAAAEPGLAALARVRRRRRPQRARAWLLVPAVAAAAAALLWSRPEPVEELLRADVPTATVLTPEVRLAYEGDGDALGTRDDLVIRWQLGRLETEVEPHQGVRLVVVTEEARVTVKGTTFTVERSALGTTTTVRHGQVEVACGSDPARTVTDGERVECLPARASGRLARARAQRQSGAPAEVVLATLDGGLALTGPTDPVRGELLATRLDVLVATGDYPAARQAAADYLAGGFTTRRGEVTEIAALLEKSGSAPAPGTSLKTEER